MLCIVSLFTSVDEMILSHSRPSWEYVELYNGTDMRYAKECDVSIDLRMDRFPYYVISDENILHKRVPNVFLSFSPIKGHSNQLI